MGQRAGYIPAAVGGTKVDLAHTGFVFAPTAEVMARWRGWWRVARADQWGVFFVGALLGMALPALLYVDALERAFRGEAPNRDVDRFFDPEEPFATCAALSAEQHAVDRRLIDACATLTDAELVKPGH